MDRAGLVALAAITLVISVCVIVGVAWIPAGNSRPNVEVIRPDMAKFKAECPPGHLLRVHALRTDGRTDIADFCTTDDPQPWEFF